MNYPVSVVNPGDQSGYSDGDQVSLPISAFDANGATLTYTATNLPTGLTIDSGTGLISGTVASFGGSATVFTTTVSAGDGTDSASQSFTWTINDPVSVVNPVLRPATMVLAVTLPISATDSTGATLTFSAAGLPAGLNIDATTGVISGTLAIDPTTSNYYSVIVTAADATYAANQDFMWSVNDPVTLTSPGTQTNNIGDHVSLALSASDAYAATLTFGATGLPPGLSINTSTGTISGTVCAGTESGESYCRW